VVRLIPYQSEHKGYFYQMSDWVEHEVMGYIEAKIKQSGKYRLGAVRVDYSAVDDSIPHVAFNSIRTYVEYRCKNEGNGLENVSVYYKQC